MKNPFRQISFNIQVTNYLNIGGSSDYVATLFLRGSDYLQYMSGIERQYYRR